MHFLFIFPFKRKIKEYAAGKCMNYIFHEMLIIGVTEIRERWGLFEVGGGLRLTWCWYILPFIQPILVGNVVKLLTLFFLKTPGSWWAFLQKFRKKILKLKDLSTTKKGACTYDMESFSSQKKYGENITHYDNQQKLARRISIKIKAVFQM